MVATGTCTLPARNLSLDQRLLLLSIVLLTFWIIYLSSLFGRSFVELEHLRAIKVSTVHVAQQGNREKLIQEQTQVQKIQRFMLVTGERSRACKTSQGSHVLMKSFKNKVDYCSLHGCRVWYNLEVWRQEFQGTWARYPVLKQLMRSNPEVNWFMWMDGDAIFTDLSFSIPFHDYEERDLVVPGYWDKVYGDNPDWVGLNAGVFLIRNSDWSLHFLDSWMELGNPAHAKEAQRKINAEIPSRPQTWLPDDQSALLYLLRHLSPPERERTFLELRYCLHGYWEQLVDKLESLELSRPFVTHFCGCSFCSSPTDRCLRSFLRAYNFADNQLLGPVNLRHLDLNSSSVVNQTYLNKSI